MYFFNDCAQTSSRRLLFSVTNLKLNNSLVTVIEGNIADIIRGMNNYAAKGFTIEGNVSLILMESGQDLAIPTVIPLKQIVHSAKATVRNQLW